MNWKTMTIGKKIATGFGIVIILLVILGAISFTGVSKIVKNATEVIAGKALDGEMAHKEVDHLNWINDVNKLLTDANINTLHVQTDHTQCKFGKWLFGEHRKEAERIVPSLAPLLREIEEPHRLLHESAIEIDKAYEAADPNLPGFILTKEIDHLHWAAAIQTAILNNATKIETQTDHTGCSFGKWLYSDAAAKTAASNPVLRNLIAEIKEPHKKLHASAKKIMESYKQVHPGLLEILLTRLDDHRKWAASVADGLLSMSTIDVETDPDLCEFGKWLASSETKKIMAKAPRINALLEKVKAPHDALHKSAIKINRAINTGDMVQAKEIYADETKRYLKEVADIVAQTIEYENNLMKGQNSAIKIFKNETMIELSITSEMLQKIELQAQKMLQGQHEASTIYASTTVPALHTVQKLLDKIRNEISQNMLTDKAMLKAAATTKLNVGIVAVIAILTALFMAFFIARGIVSVLSKITSGMSEGADQVAAASTEVSSSSQSMAEGSSQQAASIEETSSSMEELSSMTKKNAENSGHADTLMKESNQIVVSANESMGQLTQSMKDISKASEETSNIIKTIDEIAFQTNLLALNAAVEAARAGEAGAGFAVVADEVRNLAMRAAEAAKNTAELIEGIVKKVHDGSELVSTTNEAFGKVAESSSKVGELVSEISEASNEQSEGIEQINIAVTEMDKVVQQNAANAEESASAAEELNAQAEQLRDYVGELVLLTTGQKSTAQTSGQYSRASSTARQSIPGSKKKMLGAGRHEIRPNQVIPFDDDEDFENF